MEFKKTKLYRELRYVYRSLVLQKSLFFYLYYRFLAGPKIRGRREPIDSEGLSDEYSIHLLCSHSDLTMMLWSLASWYAVVPESGQVYIHEDGSFTDTDRKLLAILLPQAKLIRFADAFKMAREKWLLNYPEALKYRESAEKDKSHIYAVKLIDPRFVGQAPIKLILDTDLLWFLKPEELLTSLLLGKTPFAMMGHAGENAETVHMDFEFQDHSLLPPLLDNLNSGVVGYHIKDFQLKDLDKFCSLRGENTNPHFIEQAGYAWILSQNKPFTFLNKDQYHIKHAVHRNTVMKHYTSPRREYFWHEGVRILSKTILDF